MPARSQDHVHRLIRSMSPAEKRGFKLHLSRNGQAPDRTQELLFDAIARMDRYDETALLSRFEGASFTRHFAITKRRLYQSILNGLEAFHAESSVDVRLNRLVHQAEILHQRALYDDAAKILRSAKRVAERHQRIPALMSIREWERRDAERRNYDGIDARALQRMTDEDSDRRRAVEEIDSLWLLKSNLLISLYHEGTVPPSESERNTVESSNQPLAPGGDEPRTAKARYLLHHIRSASAFARGRLLECVEHLHKNLDLLEHERACFQDEPSLILGVVSNLAYTNMRLGRYESAFALLRRFRSLPAQWGMPETDDLDLKLFSTTTSLELSMHLRMGDFDKAAELTSVVKRGLAQHVDRIGPVRRASLQYQAAYAQFGAGSPENALRWMNDLLNGVRADDHSDAVHAGRLLHLLILLDLGRTGLLTYAMRNTERFLRLHKRKNRFEKALLQLVRCTLSPRNKEARIDAIIRFRSAVLPLIDEPAERGMFEHFDPIAWAESKLSGKSLSHHVRERARQMEQAA